MLHLTRLPSSHPDHISKVYEGFLKESHKHNGR
jgi:hypothetical protein